MVDTVVNNVDEQPRPSTSKESGEPRVSMGTTIRRDSVLWESQPVMVAAGLRRDIAGPLFAPSSDNSNNVLGYTSSLSKLQTYLPTGTWMAYTTLQTWAFSLRPGDAPTSALSNCNAHQRIALIIVMGLSTLLAFLSSFIKRFVYDTEHAHVLYPSPDIFNVREPFTDLTTGLVFPCRTKERRYCWPLVNEAGELKHDEKGRLRVMVFKLGIKICVKRKVWVARVWNSWFYPEETVAEAPALSVSASQAPSYKHVSAEAPALSTSASQAPSYKHVSLISNSPRPEVQEVTVDIDSVLTTPPTLQPRWTHTVIGAFGSKAYLDLRPCVWGHGLVSVLSFLTLALFSTQVCGCLYPSIPDYLPPTLQTGMLIFMGIIAAVFIRDDAVSLGQTAPQHVGISGNGEAADVPAYLREVVEMLVWVRQETT